MYWFVYVALYLLSLLPFRILYLFSNVAYCVLFYIIGYRKEVVHHNLLLAFPEKTEHERQKIAKAFYKNFTDNFIEVIKLISIRKKTLQKRFVANYEIINQLYDSGKNVQLHLAHLFNWELANHALALNLTYPFLVVYMPIKNKIFNKLFLTIRARTGTKLIAATRFKTEFLPFTKQRYCLTLVADQNPGGPDNAFWTDFFGKKTPFVKGPEKGARSFNTAIVVGNFLKIKRGYYCSELVLLTENAASLPEGEVTRRMVQFFEESIRKQPENYLWSHRRWKWQYDAEKYSALVV